MQIPFVGGAYRGRSIDRNPQECINFYPVLDKAGGKNVSALYGTPGLTSFVDLSNYNPVRNMIVSGGYLYAVCGDTVYKVDTLGNIAATISTKLDTTTGHVWMVQDGTYIMIVDGTAGYTITSDVLTKITDANFPVPVSLTWQDTYFIVIEKDTEKMWISTAGDPTSWAALDFTSTQGNPDNAIAVISEHRELWVFGTRTTEVYYNSGNADFTFERISGAHIERGCAAAASVAKEANTIYWLGDDKQVYMAAGYIPKAISTDSVSYQISQYTTISDAIGYTYSQDGHTFYVLNFPSADATWVYDANTTFWHKRASYPNNTVKRHRSNCYAAFNNKHYVGDYENGIVYEVDHGVYTDNTNEIISKRITTVIHDDRRMMFFDQLDIDFETGVGLATGQGSDPKVMLRWSDDGGHTWSNEYHITIGKIGEYNARAIWRRLGRSRERVFEVSVSDPVKRVILGASLRASLGDN